MSRLSEGIRNPRVGAVAEPPEGFFLDEVVEYGPEHEPEDVLDLAFRGDGLFDGVVEVATVVAPLPHRSFEAAQENAYMSAAQEGLVDAGRDYLGGCLKE